MEKNQKSLTLIILIVLVLGLGGGAIYLMTQTEEESTSLFSGSDTDQSRDGYPLEEITPGSIEVPSVQAFSVEFLSASDGTLNVRLEGGTEIAVTTTENTQVLRRENLNPNEFQQRLEEFATNTNPEDGQEPPRPFEEVEITFDQIEEGQQVLLQTVENALETKDLTAELVVVSVIPAAPEEPQE